MNTSTQTSTDRQARRAAVLDDPRFERFRTPGRRRVFAAVLGVLLAAEAALLIFFDRLPMPLTLGALVVVLLAFVLVLGTLKASTRGIEELRPEALDEHQLAERGQVYARSYRLLTIAVTAVFAGATVAALLSWAVPAVLAVVCLVVLFQAAIVIPTVVAACTARV